MKEEQKGTNEKEQGIKKDNRITEWRDRTVKSRGMTGWKNGKFMDKLWIIPNITKKEKCNLKELNYIRSRQR